MLRGRLIAILAAFCAVSVAAPASAAAAPYGERVLKLGSRGADVRTLQQHLTEVGFPTTANGVFGRGTERAVRGWEAASRRGVDGRIGKGDARTLRRAVDRHRRREVATPAPAAELDASGSGGAAFVAVRPARLNPDGTATPPPGAPEAVRRVILAGNEIAKKPYRYGGGHGRWKDSGYDCSGSVSYALHGGGLLKRSMPSGAFESYGDAGPGQWITTYANGGHMYMVVAGLRFDTSAAKAQANGSRWTDQMRSSDGFVARHPPGY